MHYRTYPNSSVTVSEVGFGLWTTATDWWGKKSEAEAVAPEGDARLDGVHDEHRREATECGTGRVRGCWHGTPSLR